MSQKPVLVIVTANNCGGCRVFKDKVLNDLLSRVTGLADAVHIELPSVSSPIPSQYPQDLKRLIGWFPTLILVPAASWRAGGSINGSVFNGEIQQGRVVPKQGGISTEEIIKWISESQLSNRSNVPQGGSSTRSPGYRGIAYRPRS